MRFSMLSTAQRARAIPGSNQIAGSGVVRNHMARALTIHIVGAEARHQELLDQEESP
jgi:hypothetical protein